MNEEDLEVIDYDSFKSDVGDDDINSDRRKVLREQKRKGKAGGGGGGNIMNFYFIGQEFPNKEEVKDIIRAHAVESRRHITIMKNDNVRVRAKCLDIILTLGDADMGSFGLSKSNGITINEGGKKQIIKDKVTKDKMTKNKETKATSVKHKAFRAKSKATEVMKGDAKVKYKILRDYVMELKKCNPNTTGHNKRSCKNGQAANVGAQSASNVAA
uniref:Transposase, mutator type n=1 Tax=Tanacetum cinerariifolium TaxID=118510 RepID=A0A6L2N5U8_TANCI|nr:transposase, mutator type [Tanacetum cinerariifolium]